LGWAKGEGARTAFCWKGNRFAYGKQSKKFKVGGVQKHALEKENRKESELKEGVIQGGKKSTKE